MLSNHSLIRIASLLLAIALWRCSPDFGMVLMITGYVHYPLSALYSSRKIGAALRDPRKGIPAAAAVAAGLGLFWWHFPLTVFFGIHHVFNEVYILKRELGKKLGADVGRLTIAALVLNTAIYCVTLRSYPVFTCLPQNIWWLVLALAGMCFLACVLPYCRTIAPGKLADLFSFELSSLSLVLLSCWHSALFHVFVVYHFVFWSFYPIAGLKRSGGKNLVVFVALHAVLLPVAWYLSPVGPVHSPHQSFFDLFILLSYLHIASSFALSNAQPDWINKLFQTLPVALPSISAEPAAVVSRSPAAVR